jgi:hypothetical protein
VTALLKLGLGAAILGEVLDDRGPRVASGAHQQARQDGHGIRCGAQQPQAMNRRVDDRVVVHLEEHALAQRGAAERRKRVIAALAADSGIQVGRYPRRLLGVSLAEADQMHTRGQLGIGQRRLVDPVDEHQARAAEPVADLRGKGRRRCRRVRGQAVIIAQGRQARVLPGFAAPRRQGCLAPARLTALAQGPQSFGYALRCSLDRLLEKTAHQATSSPSQA